MTTPTMTWTRLTRRLGSDHNPLRRRTDLLAAWLLPAVLVAFALLGPLVVVGAALQTHASQAAAARAQRSWREVPAVLLAPTPGPLMTDHGANTWLTRAPARWTAGGQRHVAMVPVVSGTRRDAVIGVWLDPAGHVRIPPLTAEQVRHRVTSIALAALAILAAVLAGLAGLGHRALNRRRLNGWEAAWLTTGPQWRGLA